MAIPDKSVLNYESTHITETRDVTKIMHATTKVELFKIQQKALFTIGDELLIGGETYIVQNSPAIHEAPSYPDKEKSAETIAKKKHSGHRVRIVTYTYRVATEATSKDLSRMDLSNKQKYELRADKIIKLTKGA